MLLHDRLFRLEALRAKRRCDLSGDFVVPRRIGLTTDAAVARVQGVISNLDKELEVFLLGKIYICALYRLSNSVVGATLCLESVQLTFRRLGREKDELVWGYTDNIACMIINRPSRLFLREQLVCYHIS